MNAFTNGGIQESRFVADLPGFFQVWYNPESMLNILAWCNIRKNFRITVDTNEGAYIKVHSSDSKVMYFEEIESGLYMFKRQPHQVTQKLSGYSFLTLASASMNQYNQTDIEWADNARALHARLGFPGYKCFF